MKKITLSQLLEYFNYEEMIPQKIQVVTSGRDWHEADELYVDSELLDPFLDFTITDIGFEKSYTDGDPILRVSIKKGDYQDEEKVVFRIDNRTYAFPRSRVS